MAHAVIMPKAGMAMEVGTVVRWLKVPGDDVRRGEPLLEIETDKVTMEVEAEADGVLLAITHGPGDEVPVTAVIGYVGASGEVIDTLDPEFAERQAAGDMPPPRPPPPPAGNALSPSARRAARAHPGRPHGDVRASVDIGTSPAFAVDEPMRASPLARTLARQHGLDLRLVRGTGPDGAVLARDLTTSGATVAKNSTVTPRATPGANGAAGAERRPLSSRRRTIASRMALSQEIPTVTLHTDADVTDLENVRRSWNEAGGPRFSLTPFVLKAAAVACRAHPLLRSSIDGDELVTHAEVHLGIAVSLEGGLLVPVLRRADTTPVVELARRADELASRSRAGSLSPDEVRDAVFTITNLGMYGVTTFDPLIDPPQSAILGVGAVTERSVPDRPGTVRRVIDLALSFDHRVMDGVEAAMALGTIRAALESPLSLLL